MTDSPESLLDQAQRLADGRLAAAQADDAGRSNDLRGRIDRLRKRNERLEAGEETPDGDDAPSRRHLLLGVAGVMGLLGVFAPKDAKAQFGGGGGGVDGLEDLVEVVLEFFELLPAMLIPTEWLNLLNQILGLLDAAGADSFSRYETIPGAIERSFPVEPPYTPEEQTQLALDRSEGSRARVESALLRNASINEQQAAMTMQEQQNLMIGQAAGSSGYGVIGLFQAMFANQTLLNQRVGHLSTQLSTLNELLAESILRQSNGDEAGVRIAERYFRGEGDDVAPIRSAPGG